MYGGGKKGADLILSGAVGAAQGVVYCAQAGGVFMTWQGYALCAAGGAAASII
ncbi:hypothetical protein HMPREF9318_02106 [Streptococcus urinalis FB127-CNA-2]|uniref:Bacteriocin class II with double-glycine leader peptide n=1 Tax=Streptococcus urinalis 2285-97 TaxID=764291 RepID=G5KIF8_9STRE|nr:hypothetical protein [Streptococcus urinalis]EHJ55669.1 hypothetical protein STRUR_1669 [Streptococcus urinalis 2285-97]EKS17229.1 hypothetical protein HMPREF9318_02106 [Streptococcus urinalis FB127-CNA-2]VEF32521.1 bacteriocin-associated protein [Streptococcus urinalis]